MVSNGRSSQFMDIEGERHETLPWPDSVGRSSKAWPRQVDLGEAESFRRFFGGLVPRSWGRRPGDRIKGRAAQGAAAA